jgi:hypothetical protein
VVGNKLVKDKVTTPPVRDVTPGLDELLAGIAEENLHEEFDTGRPVGKEIWSNNGRRIAAKAGWIPTGRRPPEF